jgi:hypothetical protein
VYVHELILLDFMLAFKSAILEVSLSCLLDITPLTFLFDPSLSVYVHCAKFAHVFLRGCQIIPLVKIGILPMCVLVLISVVCQGFCIHLFSSSVCQIKIVWFIWPAYGGGTTVRSAKQSNNLDVQYRSIRTIIITGSLLMEFKIDQELHG